MFEDPAAQPSLSAVPLLQAYLTDFNSRANAAIEQKFGIKQLPTIVFINPSGKEIPALRIDQLITTRDLIQRLHSIK